ncbi:hypothetical protein HOY80DRAFT_1085702 [Tuber brumale]|nr:hypothetical protein HOY80DRAFT_1085702 [Tuber brumale]
MRRLPPRKFLQPPPHPHHHHHRPPPPRWGAPEVSTPSPPRISRVAAPSTLVHHPQPRSRQGSSTRLLRFKITLAPQGVSRKVLELVKRASASKHLLRGGTTIQSLLSTLPPVSGGRNGDVGPVILALSCASVVGHVPIIRECNRLGVPWVYVPDSLEGEGGVVGRTGVGAVMVVPWVVGVGVGERGQRQQAEGGGVQVGEGARAVAKEFDFRDARRVVVGLLAETRDLDCEESSDFP